MKNWIDILRSFEKSGLSVRAYCGQASLKDHLLRYHLKKHSASSLSGFVRVKAHQYSSQLEVCYPNGVRVLVRGEINPTTLASLIYVQPRCVYHHQSQSQSYKTASFGARQFSGVS